MITLDFIFFTHSLATCFTGILIFDCYFDHNFDSFWNFSHCVAFPVTLDFFSVVYVVLLVPQEDTQPGMKCYNLFSSTFSFQILNFPYFIFCLFIMFQANDNVAICLP